MGQIKNTWSFPSHITYNFFLDLELEVTPVFNWSQRFKGKMMMAMMMMMMMMKKYIFIQISLVNDTWFPYGSYMFSKSNRKDDNATRNFRLFYWTDQTIGKKWSDTTLAWGNRFTPTVDNLKFKFDRNEQYNRRCCLTHCKIFRVRWAIFQHYAWKGYEWTILK